MKKSKSKVSNFIAKMKKRGIVTEYLPWLIIGIAVLAIIFISILLLKDRGANIIDQIKNIFRGR